MMLIIFILVESLWEDSRPQCTDVMLHWKMETLYSAAYMEV